MGERGVQRRLAQLLPRRLAVLFGEVLLEGNRLLEMKGFEIAEPRIVLEPRQRLGDSVHGVFVVALASFK